MGKSDLLKRQHEKRTGRIAVIHEEISAKEGNYTG